MVYQHPRRALADACLGFGPPCSEGFPVVLVHDDAAADPVIADRVGRGRRVLLDVAGQQIGDLCQIGLSHRAELTVTSV